MTKYVAIILYNKNIK